jgi:hypothetical protein
MESLPCLEDDHNKLNNNKSRVRISVGENEMEDAWSVKRWKCRGMNQDAIPFSWHRTTYPPGEPLPFNPLVAECTWHLRTIKYELKTQKATI